MTTGFLGASSQAIALAANGLPGFAGCISGMRAFVPSRRFIELENGDLIRLPPDDKGTASERTVGYRRVNKTGNDSETQWMLSVQTIINYLGVSASTSDNFAFFHAQVRGDYFYLVMRPIVDGDFIKHVHLFKVDINTGSIVNAYPIKDSVIEPFINGDLYPDRFHINVADDEQTLTICIPSQQYSGIKDNYGLLLGWDYVNDRLLSEAKIWEWGPVDASDYGFNDMKVAYVSEDNQHVLMATAKNVWLFRVGHGGVPLAPSSENQVLWTIASHHEGQSIMNVVCNDKLFLSRTHTSRALEIAMNRHQVLHRARFDAYLAQSYQVLSGAIA